MRYVTTSGGENIPILGLGTWKTSRKDAYAAVREALRGGYRHIDCAPAYGNEAEVGRALAEGALSRQDLWVTSKLWNNAHLPEQVRPALEKTLSDLRLDFLDLYLIHWPVAFRPGVSVPKKGGDYLSPDQAPLTATWRAMEDCVRQGLVRNIGVCNFSAHKLAVLLAEAEIAPVMNQVELHPYLQQEGLLDFCRRNKVFVTAYSPLGSGDRHPGMKKRDEPGLLDNPLILRVAARRGISAAQTLLAWGLARDTLVIPKSAQPEHLRENLAAADIRLEEEDMREIATLEQGYRFVDGAFFCPPGSPYSMASIWDE